MHGKHIFWFNFQITNIRLADLQIYIASLRRVSDGYWDNYKLSKLTA